MPELSNEIVLYALVGTTVIALISLIICISIFTRFRKLVTANKGYDFEKGLTIISKEIHELHEFKKLSIVKQHELENKIATCLRTNAISHFSAFDGLHSGGNQSFVVTLLNEHGDGIILSTIHARERVNVFAKNVKEFIPEVQLTEEEAQSLTQAKESGKL
jgi:hypothetical protein